MSPSGKALGSGPSIRGFESLHPSHEIITEVRALASERSYFLLYFSNLSHGFESFLAASSISSNTGLSYTACMTSERYTLRAAAYLVLVKDGKVLLLRRSNTGWRDGEYTLPAGHVDGDETIRAELCREAMEEIGITITPADLEFAHVMHQRDNHEYIDFYFAAKTWDGEPTNCEPEKCDDLRWVIPNVKQALKAYAAHEGYSEFGWN